MNTPTTIRNKLTFIPWPKRKAAGIMKNVPVKIFKGLPLHRLVHKGHLSWTVRLVIINSNDTGDGLAMYL